MPYWCLPLEGNGIEEELFAAICELAGRGLGNCFTVSEFCH
jgi:hypothetical protein